MNENFELRAYTDADQARNIDDKKSTSGGAFFLGRRLVTWTSKKQSCTSQTTAKAEYVVAAINCKNIVWIKQLLNGMREDITKPVIIYYDNISAINIPKNLEMYTRLRTMLSSIIT